MHTVATHAEAARRLAFQKAPILISGLSHAEYMRRLAHVAAQWPDRRPARKPVAVPVALVMVLARALECPRVVRGMP